MTRTRIALLAALALAATIPASAQAARVTYVSDFLAAKVLAYGVGGGGALSPLVPPSLPVSAPRQLAMTPDGTSLYVSAGAGSSGEVLQFDVDSAGTLSAKDPDGVAAGPWPGVIAVRPDGSSLYVTDPRMDPREQDGLRQFTIGPDGALEPMDEPSVPLHEDPNGVAISPDGKNAYVITEDFILHFAIGDDGQIDETSEQGLHTEGTELTDLAITPDGTRLYATDRNSSVYSFNVAANGALTEIDPGSTPDLDDSTPFALAIAPSGSELYVAGSSFDKDQRALFAFDIDAAGELVPLAAPSLPLPNLFSADLAVTPDGRNLYLAGGNLNLFDLAASGAPSAKTPPSIDLSLADALVVSPNQAPVAKFTVATAPAGSAALFDASGAQDPDGSIMRFDWDFGDGTKLLDGGPKVEHVYSKPGSYEVKLVVTDNEGASTRTVFTGSSVLGNGAPTAEAVQVIQIAAPAVLPPQAPPLLQAQEPDPDLGETIVVSPAQGLVRVRLPGETVFQPLEAVREIPVGSLVDARKGRVDLTSVRNRRGGEQKARFFQGLFQVRQRRSQKYITELLLRGSVGPCGNGDSGEARASRSAKRKLWGSGTGRFRTRGRYSSGAVRGTRWLTQDTCQGTLTVVRQGTVAVTDLVKDKTVAVEAGERYLASPR